MLLIGMLGASGWASFTLYERTTRASDLAVTATDPRLEKLLAEAYAQLTIDELDSASDKLVSAKGIASKDARVHEGLVLVAVRRAERIWWELRLAGNAEGTAKRLRDLDGAVHDAREVIADARRNASDPLAVDRIGMHERRLNTMLVIAFAASGATERARGALAARLTAHPQRALLEAYVGASPSPAASTSSSASAAPSAATAAPMIPSPPQRTPSRYGTSGSYEPPFELDHEPAMKDQPKTPGELEMPATPEATEAQ